MLARKIVVGLGIAVIFPALVYYGLSTVHRAPRYEDYLGYQPPPPSTATPEQAAALEEQARKRAEFATASKNFARIMFAVSTVLGIVAVVIGAYLAPHAVAAGLMLGGISAHALGYWTYSAGVDDGFTFVSLLAGFLALLFVGFRKLDRT